MRGLLTRIPGPLDNAKSHVNGHVRKALSEGISYWYDGRDSLLAVLADGHFHEDFAAQDVIILTEKMVAEVIGSS
jgi:hypothetical protein